jgi:hypothetical protein
MKNFTLFMIPFVLQERNTFSIIAHWTQHREFKLLFYGISSLNYILNSTQMRREMIDMIPVSLATWSICSRKGHSTRYIKDYSIVMYSRPLCNTLKPGMWEIPHTRDSTNYSSCILCTTVLDNGIISE